MGLFTGILRVTCRQTLTVPALHAYACDCITHHLFHPYGTDCIDKKEDEEMMHQVAADDSLQSKSKPFSRSTGRLF